VRPPPQLPADIALHGNRIFHVAIDTYLALGPRRVQRVDLGQSRKQPVIDVRTTGLHHRQPADVRVAQNVFNASGQLQRIGAVNCLVAARRLRDARVDPTNIRASRI
jgi:hypothetical protein